MKLTIKDYTVRNYRSCVRTRFSPNAHLSALIGRNGSGKSSMLNSFLLLKAVAHDPRYSEGEKPTAKSLIEVTFCYQQKNYSLRTTIYYSPTEKGRDEVAGASTQWNFKEFTGDDSWIAMPISMERLINYHSEISTKEEAMWYLRSQYRRQRKTAKAWKKLLANLLIVFQVLRATNKFLMGISYYSASQFTDPTKCPVSFELEDERPARRLGRGTEHTKVLHDFYLAYKNRDHDNTYFEFINLIGPNGLGLIEKLEFRELRLPQSRYEVGAGGKVIKQQLSRTLIIPNVKLDGTRLSPSQLSEGTFKTMALLFYLVSDRSRLLLIEEPEVCIHHGLLKSIIELIKDYSKTKQIVVSTHSDFVLDALSPENVFLVRKQAKFGTKISPITKALSTDDYGALRQYLADTGNLGEFWRHGGFEKND